MSDKIGIIGFGSVGKQLYMTLLENNYVDDQLFIFADDIVPDSGKQRFLFQDFKREEFKDLKFIPALGYLSKNLRYDTLNYLIENKLNIFSFIHPTAYVSKNAKIGHGVIIYPLCNIDQGAIVEDGCILLNSCIVAHDTKIGKCSYLGPGVCLSGCIDIGELTFIGTSATIANNVHVGKNSMIAMGTCLTKSIEDNSCVIGNPFQHKRSITLY